MSSQMTLKGTLNAISSPVSEDGPTQLDWLDGLTREKCGQDHVHANHSAAQDRKQVSLIKGICGQNGIGSLRSLSLQSSLENNLSKRLSLDGQTAPPMKWKKKNTPLHRQFCQLAVSARHTDGTATGLWPTANAKDHQAGFGNNPNRQQSSLPRTAGVVLGIQSGKRGTVNLNWLRWFMGFPEEWQLARPMEMPSSQE